MKNRSESSGACVEKQRMSIALQDAGAFTLTTVVREASCTAPVLWRYCLALVVGLLVISHTTFAADIAAEFAAANKLYAEGKFAEAATAYEKILHSSGESPSLLFNCGNAEFKAGHLGKAIAAYRQAKLLSPRDPELRANLTFVRNQVQGPTLRENRWQYWVSSLTLNEGGLLTMLFFWGMIGLLIARQIRPALEPKLRTATRFALVLTICSGAILVWQADNHFNSAVAVVTSADLTARSGPFDDAQSAFTARDGAELKVLDRHDDWVQVASGTGKIGWLNKKRRKCCPERDPARWGERPREPDFAGLSG